MPIKWYGVWVDNEKDFKVAQNMLREVCGNPRPLQGPYRHYATKRGVWLVCYEGRSRIGYGQDPYWGKEVDEVLEVPSPRLLENV